MKTFRNKPRRSGLNKFRGGEKYGLWTVIGLPEPDRKPLSYTCKCSCGTEKVVILRSLETGRSRSCGCNSLKLRADKLIKHGEAGSPTYKSWHAMKGRVQGKGGHEKYVERGIKMCEQWQDFKVFLSDMGHRPEGKTLDRVDNDKGYYPENCRWATHKEQTNNTSKNHWVVIKDERMTFIQASEKYNIHPATVKGRLRGGYELEAAFTNPVQYKRKK